MPRHLAGPTESGGSRRSLPNLRPMELEDLRVGGRRLGRWMGAWRHLPGLQRGAALLGLVKGRPSHWIGARTAAQLGTAT